MPYYVYMLKSISHLNNKTYVGYTTNYKKRLIKHNSGIGAKSTKGYEWVLIYKKLFLSKTNAGGSGSSDSTLKILENS